jgi:hypothetical protein
MPAFLATLLLPCAPSDRALVRSSDLAGFSEMIGFPSNTDDIRVVYNGASCGLNNTVWAPNFWLPTTKSATRVLNFNYCGVDLDLVGETFFLNFPLPILFCLFSVD